MMHIVQLFTLLSLVTPSFAERPYEGPKECSDKDRVKRADCISYTAAVFEGQTIGLVTEGNELEVMHDNLDQYNKTAMAVSEKGADMIVFPEWGLFGYCQNRWPKGTPAASRDKILAFCETIGEPGVDLTNDSRQTPIMTRLAKIAKEHKIVVIANVADKTEDDKVYNTEVAIDENGILLAKYHKKNVYFKHTFNTPPEGGVNDAVTFTKFGVKFGLFVCKDFFHKNPKKMLLEQGATHFPYSVAGPKMFGLLTAPYTYKRWAKNSHSTILISNANGGGGIFSGSGAVEGIVEEKGRFIMATIHC